MTMIVLSLLSLWAGLVSSVAVQQQPLIFSPQTNTQNPRKLQGRFLHITDLHPDPYYEPHSDLDEFCHRGKGHAGVWGTERSDCDSPIVLINATFQWIKDNIRDDIDFVIWTGDSARHDNDEDLPRSEKQITQLNKFAVDKFVEVFGKDDNLDDPDPTNDFTVPIVPNFGNNDIMPHNIFSPGPNKWTRDYADIWRKFIPEAQQHSFVRGGWFFTEVIPNKLAIFSLNTMYFFDSNSAVDGCDLKSEPGHEQMEWLRIQLQFLRERGMKAIMTGHVPPARTSGKQSWDETCWQKYAYWMRQYRDVVVAGVYGHMNIDHFMFQDAFDLKYKVTDKDPIFSVESKQDYITELRESWEVLPIPPVGMSYTPNEIDDSSHHPDPAKRKKFLKEIGGEWAERYSMSLVSPSVVPNYFPTLRIVEYNITGLEHEHPMAGLSIPRHMPHVTDSEHSDDSELSDDSDTINAAKKRKHKKKKHRKPKHSPILPSPPSPQTPPGPAYSPQTYTFTSITQYFANITRLNAEHAHSLNTDIILSSSDLETEKHYNPPQIEYELEYDTKTDNTYKLQDLTVASLLDLAHRIVKDMHEKDKQIYDGDDDFISSNETEAEQSPVSTAESGVDEENRTTLDERLSTQKKKHKKKKPHRKHRKHHGTHELWHTFVRRAFVQTIDDEDLGDME